MFKIRSFCRPLLVAAFAVFALQAQAATFADRNLAGDTSVYEGVYDAANDITWIKDWNFAGATKTRANAITFASSLTYADVTGWRLATGAEYLSAGLTGGSPGPFSFISGGINWTSNSVSGGLGVICRVNSTWTACGSAPPNLLGRFALVHAGDVSLAAPAVAAAVPEPETYAMLLAGLAGLGAMSRRKRAAA